MECLFVVFLSEYSCLYLQYAHSLNIKNLISIIYWLLGVIFATEELDYEDEQLHQLTVRATDSVTGIFAEVTVAIVIDDVNDCPPEFSADSYHISVSEASPFGTLLSKMEAYDNDTGR